MSDPDPWSSRVRDGWFYGALIVSVASVGWLFWPYVYVLLFAAVTVVVCWPVYSWLLRRLRGRRLVASILTTLLLGLLVFVPLALVLVLFALEVQSFTSQAIDMVQSGELETMVNDLFALIEPPPWAQQFLPALPELPDLMGDQGIEPLPELEGIPELAGVVTEALAGLASADFVAESAGAVVEVEATQEALRQAVEATPGGSVDLLFARLSLVEGEFYQGLQDGALSALRFAGAEIPGVIQAAVDLSIDSVIYVFAVVTLFVQGPPLMDIMKRLSPMDDEYEDQLFAVFGEFSRNLVVGSLATAGIQGVIAGVGYGIAGLGNVLFLAILTALGSFVPAVGTVVVWVPVVLYLVATGHYGMAIFLALWCLILVGGIDNVVKPLFMRGSTNMHPLLVFLAVFGGLYWMGLSGLFIGPVLVAFLTALYTMYERDYLGIEPAPAPPKERSWIAKLALGLMWRVGLARSAADPSKKAPTEE
ncbi:MAG: AI-2E family transporter [Myxococcota bacterium]